MEKVEQEVYGFGKDGCGKRVFDAGETGGHRMMPAAGKYERETKEENKDID